MGTRGFKFGKALCLVLVGLGIVCFGVKSSEAYPVDLDVEKITYDDARSMTVYSSARWYTEYFLHTADYGTLAGFCVENAAVDENASYELVGAAGIDSKALAIAKAYFSGGTGWDQGDAQIAIWEIVFDGNDGLGEGDVQYSDTSGNVHAILKGSYSVSAPISLAISPANGVGDGPSQNYLVNVSVPDASIMFLLGPALVTLGVMGRRKKK